GFDPSFINFIFSWKRKQKHNPDITTGKPKQKKRRLPSPNFHSSFQYFVYPKNPLLRNTSTPKMTRNSTARENWRSSSAA
ncbi:hypothetical protein PSY31_22995, partial [Shigella flexneri]|nr:hypothetical protein [Shigella flexneri]